jgi:hypothetical protein
VTTGNITGGNLLLSGAIVDSAQLDIQTSAGSANIALAPNGTGIVTVSTQVSAVGNVTGGNIRTAGLISATGSITGASVVGGVMTGSSVSVTGAVTGASVVGGVMTGSSVSVTGAVTGASVVGTITTAAQPNITSVGTLSSVSVSGNVQGGNIRTAGLISATGAITGASVVGGVMTGSSLSVTGTINGTTLTGTSLTVTTGNITGGNLILSGAIEDSGQLDIRTTASNSNIVLTPNGTGNVNTGANISATGRVTAASVVGGVMTGSSVSVTGAVTGASVVGGVMTGSSVSVTGAVTGTTLTGTSLTVTTGNITAGNLILSGAIEDSAQLDIRTTASNGNIVLTPNGTGVIVAAKDIRNGQANGVGNIGTVGGFFNTIFAKATSAQYADLAEMYLADANYPPGTVIEFGGSAEVTSTTVSHSTQVAGIVSTNPSYLMNSGLIDQNAIEVALVGRVPCQVVGIIAKGDRLVSSSVPGVATRLEMAQYQPGCIIGKALESYDSDTVGTIEVAVGRN